MTVSQFPVFHPASQNDLSHAATSGRQAKGSTSNPVDLSKRSAWLREMERAHISTWFKPFDASPPPNRAATPLLHQGASYFANAPFRQQSHDSETIETKIHSGEKAGSQQQNYHAFTSPGINNSTDSADGAHLTNDATQHVDGMSIPPEEFSNDRSTSAQGKTLVNSQHTLNHSIAAATQQNLLPETRLTNVLERTSLLGIQQVQVLEEINFSSESENVTTRTAILHAAQAILISANEPNAPAIRVHAKWENNKLTLWLGMDGSATQIASQAATVISELRRYLSSQGVSLERVICNGSIIFDLKEAKSYKSAVPFAQVVQQYSQQQQSNQPQPDPMSIVHPHDLPLSPASTFTQSKETS